MGLRGLIGRLCIPAACPGGGAQVSFPMLRSPALLFLLASCGAAELDGLYYSFRTGGNPSDVVDRFEARQSGETVTFFRNTRVGQTSPIDTSSAHAFESYRIDGRTLRGSVTATVQPSGDIVWSHGYTSRKEASPASPAAAQIDGVYFSFQTGHSASEVVDRFELRRSGDSVVRSPLSTPRPPRLPAERPPSLTVARSRVSPPQTFYRNTRVGQTTPIDASSAHADGTYSIHGNTITINSDISEGQTSVVRRTKRMLLLLM